MVGWLLRGARRPIWVLFAGAAGFTLTLTGCGVSQVSTTPALAAQACNAVPPFMASSSPAVVTTGIAQYKAPGVAGIQKAVLGPEGNLWFVGLSNSLNEVVGSMTPTGKFTIYPRAFGAAFDGITAGPDGNIWFTEAAVDRIGRLVPASGQISTFVVPVPLPPSGSPPRNTQVTDIVAGSDGALWFDVQQIAGAAVMPTAYIGRITTIGLITLFPVPGGDQPIGIQVGADGNIWARVAADDATAGPCQLPGYSPTSRVIRLKPSGDLTELDENGAGFAGYSVAPNGDRWWMTSQGQLRRVTAAGQVKEYSAHTTLAFWDGFRLVFGPDGNVWYPDGSNVIRMTAGGIVTIYHAPGNNSGAVWVTRGPDDRIWFVEGASGAATLGSIHSKPN